MPKNSRDYCIVPKHLYSASNSIESYRSANTISWRNKSNRCISGNED